MKLRAITESDYDGLPDEDEFQKDTPPHIVLLNFLNEMGAVMTPKIPQGYDTQHYDVKDGETGHRITGVVASSEAFKSFHHVGNSMRILCTNMDLIVQKAPGEWVLE